jgi:hypothetical protein
MTLRMAGLVVVAVCHMKKLLQVSRTSYHTAAEREGDFLKDLLQATSCGQAVQELVGDGGAKASAGGIMSSSALARRGQMLLHAPVVLPLVFLNAEAEQHGNVSMFKNEIIYRFCNAIPVGAVPVASSSYYTAQTASLLKSVKYSYRSGSQTHFRPLCVPLSIADDVAADELVLEMKQLAAAWATGYAALRDRKEQAEEVSSTQEALLREARAGIEKQRRAIAALKQQKRGEEQEILNVLGKLNIVQAEYPSTRKSPKVHSTLNLTPNVPGPMSPASGRGGTGILGDIRRDDFMQTSSDVSVGSDSISGRKLEGMIPGRSVSPRVTAVNASRSMYSALYVSPYSQASTSDSGRKRDKDRK